MVVGSKISVFSPQMTIISYTTAILPYIEYFLYVSCCNLREVLWYFLNSILQGILSLRVKKKKNIKSDHGHPASEWQKQELDLVCLT